MPNFKILCPHCNEVIELCLKVKEEKRKNVVSEEERRRRSENMKRIRVNGAQGKKTDGYIKNNNV